MKFRPELPMHDRYAVDARLPRTAAGRGGGDDLRAGERVLPLGVQLLRDRWCSGDDVLPDRLRQRLPGRGAHLAALLLPVGDEGAAALDARSAWSPVAAPPDRPGHAPGTSPSATVTTCPTSEKLAGYRRAGRRVLRDRAVPGLLRRRGWRTSTRWSYDWVASTGLRRLLRGHRPQHLPGARARPVRRALARAAGAVGQRRDSTVGPARRAAAGPVTLRPTSRGARAACGPAPRAAPGSG